MPNTEPPHPIRLSNASLSTWTWNSVESDGGGTSYGRFRDASGAWQYMLNVSNDTGVGADGEWDFASSVAADEMDAMMTSSTATVLKSGTINGTTGLITYDTNTWRIRLKFATFSSVKKMIAEAYTTST
jgi:hypothetical protein